MNRFIKAAKSWDGQTLARLLDADPAWSRRADRSGRTGLHYVAARDVRRIDDPPAKAIELADLLLHHGADIDAVQEIPDDGEIFPARPVWHAYARGHNRPLVRYLLAEGAVPDGCLWATAWNDDAEMTGLLLDCGAPPNDRFDGETPFLYAYRLKRFDAARTLLAHGADIDAPDGDRNTALHLAIAKGFTIRDTEFLIAEGADPSRRNGNGEDAYQLADRFRRRGIQRLLRRAG